MATIRKADPAIIPAQRLFPVAVWLMRGASIALVLASFVGTYVQLNGGWERVRETDDRALWAFGLTLLAQTLLSLGQWAFLSHRGFFDPWYQVCLHLSAVPNCMTYVPLGGPRLAALLENWCPPTLATVAATGAIIAACYFCDVLPERSLIK